MINDKYWIWLQNALGAGKPISALIEYFGGAKKIYAKNATGGICVL